MKAKNKGINKCPFCKSAKVEAYDTDFGDEDGPLYWTVGCNDCGAHGPQIRMYDITWWSEERIKDLNSRFRGGDARMNEISKINRARAIELWNAAGKVDEA
jgi:hypothetical protein